MNAFNKLSERIKELYVDGLQVHDTLIGHCIFVWIAIKKSFPLNPKNKSIPNSILFLKHVCRSIIQIHQHPSMVSKHHPTQHTTHTHTHTHHTPHPHTTHHTTPHTTSHHHNTPHTPHHTNPTIPPSPSHHPTITPSPSHHTLYTYQHHQPGNSKIYALSEEWKKALAIVQAPNSTSVLGTQPKTTESEAADNSDVVQDDDEKIVILSNAIHIDPNNPLFYAKRAELYL
jgi:hypothetical protein